MKHPNSDILRLRDALRARSDPLPVSFIVRAGDEVVHLGDDAPAFELSIRNPAGMAAVLSLQELAIAEAYIRGDIDLEGDLIRTMALRDLLADREFGIKLWQWVKPALVGRKRCNPQWIAQHYDAENIQLLAVDRRYNSYTPGIYENEDDSLEEGALRKFEAAFSALRLEAGATLLDVGCGWGGFLRYCAERDVAVTGITLSRHQLRYVEECLRQDGLPAQVVYQDFFAFDPGRRFDGISLMGVLEDLSDYRRVMTRLARWVQPHGRIYCDFAASNALFGVSSFITKYVWPGAFRLVHLPGLTRAIGWASLELVELHNDRRNYYLWVKKVHDRWVERRAEVLSVSDEQAWRTFRLLCAGVAGTMADSTERATAFRLVLAPRRR